MKINRLYKYALGKMFPDDRTVNTMLNIIEHVSDKPEIQLAAVEMLLGIYQMPSYDIIVDLRHNHKFDDGITSAHAQGYDPLSDEIMAEYTARSKGYYYFPSSMDKVDCEAHTARYTSRSDASRNFETSDLKYVEMLDGDPYLKRVRVPFDVWEEYSKREPGYINPVAGA